MTSPTPKRRNAPRTKAQILAAAQQAFAEEGYAQTGIREIAAQAGVTSPMLHRYFGTKASLFETALAETIHIEGLFDAPRHDFGELLASVLRDPDSNLLGPSIVALAIGHTDARDIAAHAAKVHVLEPLAEWLGPPDGAERAFEIVMMGMGFVLCSRQLPLLPDGDRDVANISEWFAQTVQAIVDRSAAQKT
ncbi:TetR/AcrR family transcriptional regulator [Williamsia sp.]|uniref:TetR/AcrR family transcriptional regulator n=1 Tax=Williamsia sp. TaxID=1872085 RepID=UPI002F95CFC2